MKQPILTTAFALAVLGTWAPAAQAELTPLGQIPTRMSLCQDELQGGGAAKPPAGKMRECLARRAEAETTVAAQCERDLAAAEPKAADPVQARRSCIAQALRVPYAQLPRGQRGTAALAKSKNRAAARAPKPKTPATAASPAPDRPVPVMPEAGDSPRSN